MKSLMMVLVFMGLLFGGNVFAQAPAVPMCGVKTVLNWDPNTETDLEGYSLYMSPVSADLADVTGMAVAKNVLASVPMVNGKVQTSVPLAALAPEVMNYFVVTAYDQATNESLPTMVVSCNNDQIPGQVQGLTIINIP